MIRPEEVSALTAVISGSNTVRMLYDRHTVNSLADLMKMNPKRFTAKETDAINKAYRMLMESNKKGKEACVYPIPEYSDKRMNQNDRYAKFSDLLLHNISGELPYKYQSVRYSTVADIKRYLSLVSTNGENSLIACNYQIGKNKVDAIFDKILMYQKQIERQYELTPEHPGALFNMDRRDKERLLREYYSSVIDYLISSEKDSLWTKLTERQKDLLFMSISKDSIIRDTIVKDISNYMTLPEVENLPQEGYKTLDRFLINK